jgi:hypothetical protein
MKYLIVILFVAIIAVNLCSAGCAKFGIDYKGNDIDSVTGVSSWQACAKLCKNHRSCSYWSWRMPGGHDARKCWLKSSDNGRKDRDDQISGHYSCTS